MKRLFHYSDKPLISVRNTAQGCREGRDDKPCGLWISVQGEDDWPSWCADNNFGQDRLALAHEIVLTPSANILRLSRADDLDAFTFEYGARLKPYHSRIDWNRVATLYQGIIIAPYIHSRRLTGHAFWYYGWDVASGCIWDASAIDSIIPQEDYVPQ